ncbi:phytoene desaturase family protein [Dyadobacter fanqingshengii]|uniref:Phytoene desaturase family protein n=1 Tax=Dyadobacter fanqingshengii TaxID=2906443 RepID=A0A9X1T9U5_9BACT|nr:phytoene desaturase family protein [Dyadobacter fanqingshengii]MCF0041690.1 phytoene desaturase family protein [Dyadobacter fanqingshengii]USJ36596.1 phytoene desaturase family protein [Dyadobacter fanqingshengii]
MHNRSRTKSGKSHEVAVIGAGFAGLAAASVLAESGNKVTVFEKNTGIGGRARTFSQDGFLFDMGPSWYWMPDVYDSFFALFGKTTSDFYELKKLDPGFAVIFENEVMDIPADYDAVCALFESIETGSGAKLRKFIAEGEFKYMVGMNDMVYKPGHSVTEFFSFKLFKDALKLQLFTSFSKHVRQYFKDPRLLALIEFPVLFLGAMPKDTPALYSLMNFAGLKQGTFYPMGGFGKVAESFKKIAEDAGVSVLTAQNIEKFDITSGSISHLHTKNSSIKTDAVIGSADYHHIEQHLLDENYRTYDEDYWENRTFAPSCLLFYLGVNKKIDKLRHHNLFFDENFDQHAVEIYKDKKWPKSPLFYVCCPSKTDPSVAPEGSENLFVLMPIAIGLADPDVIRETYFNVLMERLEKFAGENIRSHVVFKKSYSVSDFISDYNAFKGNAYGLANTLMQTAIFKPKLKSSKVRNLFYAGQLTVPGPGVPPSIISGRIAATELQKYLNTKS